MPMSHISSSDSPSFPLSPVVYSPLYHYCSTFHKTSIIQDYPDCFIFLYAL